MPLSPRALMPLCPRALVPLCPRALVPKRASAARPYGTLAAILILVVLISCAREVDPGKDFILIYNGISADDDGVLQMEKAAEELGYEARFISRLSDLPDQLEGAALFVIGGTSGNTARILDPLYDVADDLKAWIRGGGHYLGICGGAYIASRGSQWDDGYEEGLALVDAESFKYDPNFEDPQIITVTWQGTQRPIYYLNGPAFRAADLPGVEILARYPDNRVAAFITTLGSGKIALCGPHPEAEDTWLIDDPEPRKASLWTPTWDLFISMLQSVTREP